MDVECVVTHCITLIGHPTSSYHIIIHPLHTQYPTSSTLDCSAIIITKLHVTTESGTKIMTRYSKVGWLNNPVIR